MPADSPGLASRSALGGLSSHLHPLLALVLLRPHLLIEHVGACAEMFGAEADQAGAQWRRQCIWWAVAIGGLMLALALAGTAVLLWAALPAGSLRLPWLLWVVPLLPLVPGLLALFAASRRQTPRFGLLRRQLADDLRLLQQATAAPLPGAAAAHTAP